MISNSQHGIYLNHGSSENFISRNLIQGNGDTGIYIEDSDSNTVFNNTCYENTYREIQVFTSNYNNFTFNDITDSFGTTGIYMELSNYSIILNNTLYQIETMIHLVNCTSSTIIGNNLDTFLGGIGLIDSPQSTVRLNDLYCNGGDIGVWNEAGMSL